MAPVIIVYLITAIVNRARRNETVFTVNILYEIKLAHLIKPR